jgi:hypothetical protein
MSFLILIYFLPLSLSLYLYKDTLLLTTTALSQLSLLMVVFFLVFSIFFFALTGGGAFLLACGNQGIGIFLCL